MILPAAQLSVVVPVFEEEDNILPLAQEISQALERQSLTYQIVFVDDASRDRTWAKIEEARLLDPHVCGLRHGRNAGQSAAVWTGLSHTNSRWIATLDGDRQNDPADLVVMIEQLRDLISFVVSVFLDRTTGCARSPLELHVPHGARH